MSPSMWVQCSLSFPQRARNTIGMIQCVAKCCVNYPDAGREILGGRALLLNQLNPFNHLVPHETMQPEIRLALDLNELHAGSIPIDPPDMGGINRQ